MVTRNADSFSFSLGIIAGIIGVIALVLTCVGVSFPTWYIHNYNNRTAVIAQANLFYSCYAPNVSLGVAPSQLTCVSYKSFTCSTTSYQRTVFNVSTLVEGCVSPNSDAAAYIAFEAPIYQVSTRGYYQLRSAAVLSIICILFIFFSAVLAFVTSIVMLNIYLVFLAPILAAFAVIFGVACLVTAAGVFRYIGTGFAVYATGVLIEVFGIVLLSLVAGRLHGMAMNGARKEDESAFIQRVDSPIVVRRVVKRRN